MSVIIGAKKAEQLVDNIGATKVALGARNKLRDDFIATLAEDFEKQGAAAIEGTARLLS